MGDVVHERERREKNILMTTQTPLSDNVVTNALGRRQALGLLAAGTSLAAFSGWTTATTGPDSASQPVTALFGFIRKEGMSHEEFVEYYQNNHIPLTREALADEGVDLVSFRSILPVDPTASPFDGVGELTFADLDTFQQATETEGWQRAIADVPNFTQPERNAVVVGTEQSHLQSGDEQAAKDLARQHITMPVTGNFDGFEELHTAGYVGHGLVPGEMLDREGLRQFHMGMAAAFPDLEIDIHESIAEGNVVAARWTGTGTHEGELFDLPASGNEVTFGGQSFFRIANGKVAESWTQVDLFGLFNQIGVVVVLPHWVEEMFD